MTKKVIILLLLAVVSFGTVASAGVFEDFESGITTLRWTNAGNWGTLSLGGSEAAWSNGTGPAATGALTSVPIEVPADGYLTLRVNGHDVPDKDADGFWGGPDAHWVEVRGGGSAGPVLARLNSYENTLRDFRIDARGYSTVTVVGVDNGATWAGMDDIETVAGNPRDLITNGSLEDGFTGWTVSGTAWQALAKAKPYWETTPRYGSEGGLFATTYEDEPLTGTVTSPPIIVTRNTLVFDAAGYSGGPWGGGNDKFNLLDSSFNIIAQINGEIGPQGVLQGGTWVEKSFNLYVAGLDNGDTFYFQAVDGDTGSYGWIAFDNVRQESREYGGVLKESMDSAGQNLVNSLRPIIQGALPYWELKVDDFNWTARFNPGSEFHNIGRVWDALLRLENATGFEFPANFEAELLTSTQAYFNNNDNLCWTPLSWAGLVSHQFETHSFREFALALNALAKFRGNIWAAGMAPLLAATLSNATDMGDLSGPDYQWILTNFWYYNEAVSNPGISIYTRFMDPVGSNGRLIEALVHLYQSTGSQPVLDLAGQYAAWHLANSTNADGTLNEAVGLDHTHSYMATMRGLLLYGELTGQQQYIDNVAATYGVSIRNNLIKESGWNPHDWMGTDNAEPASAADSAEIACILGRLGHDEYLDDVERLVRCLILPSQIKLADMTSPLTADTSDGDQGSNPDRYDNLTLRNVGGYGGMHNMNGAGSPYGGKQCTTDVTASVLSSLTEIYNSIVVHDGNVLKINFHFDYDDPNIVNILTRRVNFESVVTATVKTGEDVLIRIPQWTPADSIELSVNGSPVPLVKVGNFAQILSQSVPMVIELKYGLPIRTTFELPDPDLSKPIYQILWQGDEITNIDNNNNVFMPFYSTLAYPPYLAPEYSIESASSLGKLPISPLPDPDNKYDWGGSVIKDGANSYKMWWVRQDPYDTIYYASSTDGVNWSNAQKVLEAANNAYEKLHVGRPSVVKVGSTYHMFYEAPKFGGASEYGNQIFTATSSDGINWTKYPSNGDPQPVIAIPSVPVGAYGIGQPSVFYKDGEFNIYYACNVAKRMTEVRMARSSSSTSWGSYATHEVVGYGSGMDVKWNSALNKYIMAYTIGDWITPDPNQSEPDTYNLYIFTSDDGKVWNDYTTPYVYQVCTDATNVTYRGFNNPKTRAFANLVSTDQYGGLDSPTMKVVFMEGNMHAVPGDWRSQSPTWDLHSLSFTLGRTYRISDLNDDGAVDMLDLEKMTYKWLLTGVLGSIPEDIAPQPDGDGIVNFLDFALLAQDWLIVE